MLSMREQKILLELYVVTMFLRLAKLSSLQKMLLYYKKSIQLLVHKQFHSAKT